MRKRTFALGFGGMAVGLAIAATVAFAVAEPWTGNKDIGPINGSLTTIIRTGVFTAECRLEEGEWTIVKANEKHEGKSVVFEVSKFGECSMTAPEKAAVTFGACSLEVPRETGAFKGIKASIVKQCSVKIATKAIECEVILPVASNKSLESMEVVNKKEPAAVELVANFKNVTAEVKGSKCGEIKTVKGTGELKTDKLLAEGLQAN